MSNESELKSERDKKKEQEAIMAVDTAIATIKTIKQKTKRKKS